jgi:hypothetical protein
MRARSVATLAVTLLVVSACGRTSDGAQDASDTGPTDVGEPSAATKAPVSAPPTDDAGPRFSPALFGSDSATVDNPFYPLTPGMEQTYEGHALDGDEKIERRIVITPSGFSKVIAGVHAAVVVERDFDGDDLGEQELSFEAQDKEGNVWHLGEYVETFEDQEFIGGRVWVANDPVGAQAGLLVPANPRPSETSFSEGFAPPPWNWDDRGRVRDTEDERCVAAGCFKDVVVMEEFEPSIPDAFQLKYYARGVGAVEVGWDGGNEAEQEELELVSQVQLRGGQLAALQDMARAMEDKGASYSRLGSLQSIGGTP